MMKKLTAVFAVALVLVLSAFGVAESWKPDQFHSNLGFTITHMGISDVVGNFKKFDVKVQASKADFSDAQFVLTADVASINTEVGMRDDHLRSADFFDVAKHPTMAFKSTGMTPAGKDRYKLAGNLTIKGVTKPVVLDLWYRGTIENPMNKDITAGFKITGTIKRSDFGLGMQFPAPMISDEVQVEADGEFIKE